MDTKTPTGGSIAPEGTSNGIRVDGENFAAAPVERIIAGYPGVGLVAVYAVPAPDVGDRVMAALQLDDPEAFDPGSFDAYLTGHADLGTKWSPAFVRTTRELPATHTAKVLKRQLRAERWETSDPVWWRPARGAALERLDRAGVDRIRAEFSARGRVAELEKL